MARVIQMIMYSHLQQVITPIGLSVAAQMAILPHL